MQRKALPAHLQGEDGLVKIQVSSVMETLLGACEKRQEFATRGLDRLMAAFEGHKQVHPSWIICLHIIIYYCPRHIIITIIYYCCYHILITLSTCYHAKPPDVTTICYHHLPAQAALGDVDDWLHSECQGVDISGSSGVNAQYQGLAKVLQGTGKSNKATGQGSIGGGEGGNGEEGGEGGNGEAGKEEEGEKEVVVLGGIQKVCAGMSADVKRRRDDVQGLVDLVHGLVEEDTGRYRDFIAVTQRSNNTMTYLITYSITYRSMIQHNQ